MIYHLIEDEVFERCMAILFGAVSRYVIVYSSDSDDNHDQDARHVRHRQFSRRVASHMAHWRLVDQMPNRYPYRGDYLTGSFADLYVYARSRPQA